MAEYIIGNVLGPQGEPGAKGADGTTVAVKLGSTQYNHTGGVINLPAYPTSLPASGGNSTTVNEHTVNSDVPSNAKFTDTVYTHPTTHPPSIIVQDINNRFVSDSEKSLWGGKQDALGYTPLPISNGVLENYREKLVTLSGTSTTIDLSLGNVFTHT